MALMIPITNETDCWVLWVFNFLELWYSAVIKGHPVSGSQMNFDIQNKQYLVEQSAYHFNSKAKRADIGTAMA